jgi:FAD/FMN-containing dehydrogenase
MFAYIGKLKRDRGRPCPSAHEAREEKRLLRLQAQLATCKLRIIDDLGACAMSIMQAIKGGIDPDGIMNPGKIF